MNTPLVSVIIPCYNAEPYIDLCLDSLVNQTYHNIEIIICDDASKDNSYQKLLEWSKKDKRICVLKNQTNSFAAATRNKCIEASHGDFIMLQDVDDVSAVNRVEVLLKEFEKHPQMAIISSAVKCFDSKPENFTFVLVHKPEFPTKWSMVRRMALSHPASMIRREAITAVGGYRVAKETRRCQDYDMYMRIYAKGYRGMNLNYALYYYRCDEANYKRRTFKARVGEYRIRLRGYKEMGVMPWAFPFAFIPFLGYIKQSIINMFSK